MQKRMAGKERNHKKLGRLGFIRGTRPHGLCELITPCIMSIAGLIHIVIPGLINRPPPHVEGLEGPEGLRYDS